MANDDRKESKIFGDLEPNPGTRDHIPGSAETGEEEKVDSMEETNPVTGGTGTETGGTRNYRQGTGATGGDIGNRPE